MNRSFLFASFLSIKATSSIGLPATFSFTQHRLTVVGNLFRIANRFETEIFSVNRPLKITYVFTIKQLGFIQLANLPNFFGCLSKKGIYPAMELTLPNDVSNLKHLM